MTSQEQVTTSFSSFQEDMSVINAASQESGPVARGSIAVALTQNDDDESDVFTDQTMTAPVTDPPIELGGVRVKVAGAAARILAVAPDQIRFIVPAGIEPSESVLAQVTNGVKVFNARITVEDAAPGLFTQSGEGTGTVAAKCGLVLSNGTIEYSDPPCGVSTEVETRTLVLAGTGWRYASGVKVAFDNIELTPTYAGPEPGLPGVDRIELTLTQDLSGRENDIIVNAWINGETASSRAGAKIAFQALDQSATPGSARLGACCRPHEAPLKIQLTLSADWARSQACASRIFTPISGAHVARCTAHGEPAFSP
jgi:uncharacterized protein (TIGR03437 family)